jgi:hypothetical protein
MEHTATCCYRSLGKQIQKSGKLITDTDSDVRTGTLCQCSTSCRKKTSERGLYMCSNRNHSIRRSHPLEDLYKIGYSSTDVDQRIKNAKNEATYLFADVRKVATYQCYNRNADKLEESTCIASLPEACLDVDLFNDKGAKRLNPREWFVVPFPVIDEVIKLILKETILNYEYDEVNQSIVLKRSE